MFYDSNIEFFNSAPNVLLTSLTVISFIYFLVLLHYVFMLSVINVNIGKPPDTHFQIAYKYAYRGRSSCNVLFYKLLHSFPSSKGIKLCYTGPKASYIEYAYGIILDEDTSGICQMKDYTKRNIFNVFNTPDISHALYIILPVGTLLPSFISHWIAIAIGYVKIHGASQKHNLCAYPVLEIYGKKLLSIIVPLIRQDEFVVWEAERIVFGRHFSAMLRPLPQFGKASDSQALPTSLTKSPRKGISKKKRG